MTDLRKLARGKQCHLRLPGCLPGNETVVLAHLRIGGIAGMGQKPVDLAGLPCCDRCHSQLDGRAKSPHSRAQIHADALRGLLQWQTWLVSNGHISI